MFLSQISIFLIYLKYSSYLSNLWIFVSWTQP